MDYTRAVSPSSEFTLLANCCVASFKFAVPRPLKSLNLSIDWNRFVGLARFHRLEGVAWSALSTSGEPVPTDVLDSLAHDTKAIAGANLVAALAARDILAEGREQGVDLLILKGLTTGALAFRSGLLKNSADADFLVRTGQLEPAVALLRSHGFAPIVPNRIADIRHWHDREKESLWLREDGLAIDLHTRLSDNPRLIPTLGMNSPRQNVEVVPGVVLPTLAHDELIAYLCVHGATSAWFRLKWAADLAGILSFRKDLCKVHARCVELGAGRACGQGLLLVEKLFREDGKRGLRQSTKIDRRTSWLYSNAMRQLVWNRDPVEPTSSPLGTVRIHLTQLLLGDAHFGIGEGWRQCRSAFTHWRSRRRHHASRAPKDSSVRSP